MAFCLLPWAPKPLKRRDHSVGKEFCNFLLREQIVSLFGKETSNEHGRVASPESGTHLWQLTL